MSQIADLVLYSRIDKIDYFKITQNITVYNVPELIESLSKYEDSSLNKVVFDFESARFIDSSGLGFILRYLLKKSKFPKHTKFIMVNQTIQHLFQISGAYEKFHIYSSLREALDSSW
jgi:anti-anti-sigma factor